MTTQNSTTSIEAVTAEQKLREILTAYKTTECLQENFSDFREWFLQHFKVEKLNKNANDCTLESFSVYFLNAIRQHTYQHLRLTDLNEKPITLKTRTNSQQPTQTAAAAAGLCSTPNPIRNASTPIRRVNSNQQQQQQSQNQRRSYNAMSNNSSFERSRNSTSDGSFCLGDFIISSPNNNNRHQLSAHKKKLHAHAHSQQAAAVTTTTTTPKSNSAMNNKPKKRVVPISIGKTTTTMLNSNSNSNYENNSPFGVHSRSFDSNNIFMHTPTIELSDSNKSAIEEARKALKRDLNDVSTALKVATTTSATTTSATTTTPNVTPIKPKKVVAATDISASVSHVTHAMQQTKLNAVTEMTTVASISFEKIPMHTRHLLQFLANIYALLIDMNFVINILNEFSFLFNLLNAAHVFVVVVVDDDDLKREQEFTTNEYFKILEKSINSIYFAVCVLENQQQTLKLIDTKSLGVVLQCERFECLKPTLKKILNAAYEEKQTIAHNASYFHFTTASGSNNIGIFKNVCFQEDSDSRKFFPSTAEFGAFKTQRDLFYIALKLWEKNHLNPSWNFNIEVTPKVRDIFRQSEHPVNMSHFAKLFVSQLLVSASDKTSPEEIGIGNDDVDLQKFNKLTQRLVALSNFSVDYQFPREQAFFRDFIIESRSLPFMEHLKMVIYAEIITLNDSTLEHFNLLATSDERYNELHERYEFIVEPSILNSMLILAKFLGFITALPYQIVATNTEININATLIQNYQLKLRQLFNTPFDVRQLLDVAVSSGRYLITLPWLVQYMAMLDEVTLQLSTYVKALQKMFMLYATLGLQQFNQKQISPMSSFIIRCCLGWLFEQKPHISTEYYNYRATFNAYNEEKNIIKFNTINTTNSIETQQTQTIAILESLLTVACPYLAEFRVSIMPAKYALTKYVSRSGRYRHITPCIAETPPQTSSKANETNLEIEKAANSIIQENSLITPISIKKQCQRKLMESFLHAQNSSMRRLIIFLTEHTYKCVIKDAQHQILIPSKNIADGLVNEITCSNYETVYAEVTQIYSNARIEAIQQWDTEVPNMLKKRVTQGLAALLPIETAQIVKQAYAWRIQSDVKCKIEQWRHMHLIKHDFYCNDLQELTEKLCKANINRPKPLSTIQSTELKLKKSIPSISDLLEEMQYWMYTTSGGDSAFRPEQYSNYTKNVAKTIDEAFIDYLARLTSSFENVLPTIYYRLIGTGLIQILQHLITIQPAALTPAVINAVCNFCMDKRMQNADDRTKIAISHDISNLNSNNNSEKCNAEENIVDSPNAVAATTIYHALIQPPFIESLAARRHCFDKLKELLLAMIERGLFSIDYLNELFVGVFKQDLKCDSFNEISRILSEIAQKVHDENDANNSVETDDIQKSKLFMEILADFSRDTDNF